jgi:hypothetical protein
MNYKKLLKIKKILKNMILKAKQLLDQWKSNTYSNYEAICFN